MMRSILFALALVAASPTFAADTSVLAPDPSTLVAARELMQSSDFQGQMKAMGPRVATAMEQQMHQMFKDNAIPEGLNSQLTAALKDYLGTMGEFFTPEFVDQLAGIYARHFTADELRHISVMLKDPVMQKFQREMPTLMSEMMPMMFEAMKPRQQLLQQKIKQIVTDWVANHPADKAKLRSPAAS